MKSVAGFLISLWLILGVAYVNNVIDLFDCDFKMSQESDLKCEVVHGVGLFLPPTSIITSFFDSDGEK